MTKPLIDQAVDRFLGWKLPKDFNPDAGITFKADFNEGTPYPMKHEPSGTNLFTATQAKAMLDHAAAPLIARVAELEATNDRLLQDRLDYSQVTTTEGLNASEWIWRTGKAERRVAELEAVAQAAVASVKNPAWSGICDEDVALEQALIKAKLI